MESECLITNAEDLPANTEILDRIRLLSLLPPGAFELIVREDISDSKLKRDVYYPFMFVGGVLSLEGEWYVSMNDTIINAPVQMVPLHDIISQLRISTAVKFHHSSIEEINEGVKVHSS